MKGNTFGKAFKISTFGESHGKAIGVVIDGCPAGLEIDTQFIQDELNRRKPGQSKITTSRNESDEIEILSGISNNTSLGTPIAMIVRNKDAKAKDYDHIKDAYRPSHADYTYDQKYGIKDHRGGGRSSARETIARVASGAIAKLLLQHYGIKLFAYTSQVYDVSLNTPPELVDSSAVEDNVVRCPDKETASQMIQAIEQAKKEGNTLGGKITCIITNCPAGIGEPVFDKLQADLAKAMLSINAVKGFEYGSGFNTIELTGKEHNDEFESKDGQVKTKTNHSGGIQGGISNGMPIYFNVAFKAVSTLMQDQTTINKDGKTVVIEGKGRHDPCVVPRAVPIVEAMAALVIADHLLRQKTTKL